MPTHKEQTFGKRKETNSNVRRGMCNKIKKFSSVTSVFKDKVIHMHASALTKMQIRQPPMGHPTCPPSLPNQHLMMTCCII